MSKKMVYCALSVFFSLLFATVISASAAPRLTISSEIDEKFITYTDPRFDFSVQYPETWYLIPRDDTNPDALGGLVSFVPSTLAEQNKSDTEYQNSHDEVPQIIIGLYLAEQETDQSLYQWTERYEAVSNDFDEAVMQRQTRQVHRINKSPAVHESGLSPLTTYQFTNLSHGKTVWFVWTNITTSQEDPYSTVYENIVKSFKFGNNSPTSLKQVYGESFEPLKLSETQSVEENVNQSLAFQNTWKQINSIPSTSMLALSSSWKSPVLKQTNGNPRNVRCGSEAHNDNFGGTYSKYAADIGASEYTNVYAAMGGNVSFAGWANNGYGNLVTVVASDGKEAYYAHLRQFFPRTGSQVSTLNFIASSGNTSTTPGMAYHLHFHVRQGNSSVNLTGMSGFTSYGNYPGSPGTYANCGSMGR